MAPQVSTSLVLPSIPLAITSKILDGHGKASLRLILQYRDTLQSGTTEAPGSSPYVCVKIPQNG
jgi:hypothetical protein